MKSYKPFTPSRRQMTGIDWSKLLSTGKPKKSLTSGLNKRAGRNSFGRVTMNYQGGGHKRRFRDIDFIYDKKNIPAKVETIEYDPNRTGLIGLLCYNDGERRYSLLPQGVKVGDVLISSEKADIKPGNRLPLKEIPTGTFVYNVELTENGGSKIARSAGNYVQVVAQDAGFTHLKMPSTEIRKVKGNCWASIGAVSNEENWLINIGKAGRNRWLGKKPKVRASARNPVDHPYGGGEGKQGRGRRRAITRTGLPVGKGQKSRRAKKYSNIFIVSRRRVGDRGGETQLGQN
ncbi:MAG: 50S ribosomal protein L2 [Candidatus Taylorbacteria bacterium RIFCSPLOWO2_02_FULL_43_11]|uniref:50S ribosomal protein L2 n=1 Tax=Candidatus Taylorbacteria bacterium RIFCSPHIGHO2_02_FULL_43_32b TaxID=1802306 RepID=A0A1G2MH87_9BACT|nr:MAG: 50S ribosomal protein L2 [Candidatus Taylorbacteria bacterium RIFCSPHIGHO2_01_FULL_43_47]OHA23290.1 MAG: 50S ribosomal protein L2 [Candidatus Taylorbacteria bacterium RIFCSPHIGHO2_02_FULL_43_32b]OHA30158.1 MAG: 50S ribosomal protein L2 [Candidatus Taylorbacteria bacterium RIFCSPLOWO2_01_FULL_43_44]OHA36032.1 MAG: 50S ribosomal protein L2 [Candidatus Taylorbacteria bacterium RIFCSPLOWO2_02_FULL_43_11]